MSPITQAVISAGGAGTRLRPFTDISPKPMVPILGKPLLEWHIEQYKKHGVQEFFFMLGYLSHIVMDYFGDGSRWGITIQYQTNPLGSAGGLTAFASALAPQFYFIYGDVFSLIDYTRMAQVYAQKKSPIGMERVGRSDTYADADVVELDQNERFINVHKKPHTNIYPNAYRMRGSFLLDRAILSYIPEQVVTSFAQDVLPKVIADGKNFYGYESPDYSQGIDTIEKLHAVENYLHEKQITPWW